ncbi:MAG TPA: hypothetical protein VNH46_00805, partial [Gemmatimonadales bacterium]|nr:hypothetical protein [Gemmatimonadales bacterium]
GLRTGSLRYQGTSFALSPDGSHIAYVADTPEGTTRLYLRERDELVPRAVDGTDGADSPFFSPDSRWVGYLAGHRLYKVPVDGGAPIPLADSASGTLPSAAWSDHGEIAYTTLRFGIDLISSDGGNSRPVTSGGFTAFPVVLPRQDLVLATNCTNNCAQMRLIAAHPRTGAVDTLRSGIARSWFLPPDLLVSVRQDGSVVGAHFDPASLRLSRTEVPLLTGVQLDLGVTPQFALAGDGTAVYQAADSGGGNVTVVRVDRQGHTTVLDPAWRANINTMALSPDGRRLAVSIASGSRTDLWVKQLEAGPLTRLTFTGSLNYRPAWLPDGRSLIFSSDRAGSSWLYRLRADGSGQPERLLAGDTAQIDESLVSPDGQWLIYRAGVTDGVRDIFARHLSGDTARVSLADSRFDEYMPTLSPDGRWLAYVSVESGQEEVYVRPFPHADRARFQISTQGGAQPLWSPDGRQLYYMSRDDSLIAVETSGTPEFHTGARRTLFSTRGFAVQPFHQSYAVTPDGRGFIMFQPVLPAGGANHDLIVVLN